MTKTLTQLSKEELEAFEKDAKKKGIGGLARIWFKSWLLAHDRRIIEAAFAATEAEKHESDCGQNPDYPIDKCTPTCGRNAALTEVNNLKQEFLS